MKSPSYEVVAETATLLRLKAGGLRQLAEQAPADSPELREAVEGTARFCEKVAERLEPLPANQA